MANENVDILGLLDELHSMVSDAWGVPLGNERCVIDREKAMDIIDTIRNELPPAVAEAKRLVSARDEFIGNAKREAEALRKSAEEKSKELIDNQEVVRIARTKSAETINAAETKSLELRRLASDYVEDIMSSTEENLKKALATLQSAHTAFKTAGGNAAPKSKPPVKKDAPQEEEFREVPFKKNKPEKN